MNNKPEIPKPPGYRSAVPFDRKQHRQLGVSADAIKFAANLHIIYLTRPEISRASLDYPVVFAREAADVVVPIAVVGVEPGVSLCCDEQGQWDDQYYCPAYVRRYPFFMASLAEQHSKSIICVDDSALDDNATPCLINALGEVTPGWEERLKLIEEFGRAEQHTRNFCERLVELDLLEKFDADFHPVSESQKRSAIEPQRLAGLLRISRAKLNGLEDHILASLVRDGTMPIIEAHLLSVQRFDWLLSRYASQVAQR